MRLGSIIALFSLLLATSADAQPADPGESAYQAGRRAYDLREWDKAIDNFKEAYRLRSDASSLFNIAQSYRLKGDCVEALGFYKTYKRNFPAAPNIDAVTKLIAELEPCAKEKSSKAANPVAPTPMSAEPKRTESRYEDRGKTKRTAGIVVAGAGVAIVGTGFLFGKLAKDKADEVTRGGNPDMPPEFNRSVDDAGKRYDVLAKLAWGLGGAAVVGGVVLYVMGNSAKETLVSVVPLDGGGMIVYGSAAW